MQNQLKLWKPFHFLEVKQIPDNRYAIIILNRPISIEKTLMIELWNRAAIRITVDGGTDRWLKFCSEKQINSKSICAPDFVSGDFDSISEEAMAYIKQLGCEICPTPDQNETDFTKSLRLLSGKMTSDHLDCVVSVCETSGRFDQILANVNSLYKSQEILPKNVRVYLMSSCSLTWLLDGGQHRIDIPEFVRQKKRWCALIPIGNPVKVTTTGLKWDLNNGVLEFGGMVSTSNTYSGQLDYVDVETDGKVVWSMGTFSHK